MPSPAQDRPGTVGTPAPDLPVPEGGGPDRAAAVGPPGGTAVRPAGVGAVAAPAEAPRPGHTEPDHTETVQAAKRTERSPRDMALSLLILLVPIALFLAFYRVVLGGDEPVVVDPAPAVASARAARAFPVLEPTGLPSGWRPVSAAFQRTDGPATLRIGYVSPAGDGVQVVQSNAPVDRLLSGELTGEARPTGTVELGGRTWQSYTARPGERALVLLEPNRTVIVVGAAGEQELRGLTGALR